MKILFLAPHPFYQDRGTPIAVDLLLRTLSERGEIIDLLTYHEGIDREYKGVTIHRIAPLPLVKNIRPGLTVKKIICDIFMHIKAMRMARKGEYDIVHAVEESVFMALSIKKKFHIPYVCDMDSSMPEQIAEKKPWMSFMLEFMRKFEKQAVLGAESVVAVCNSLVDIAKQYGAKEVVLLTDISLLPEDYEFPDYHDNGEERSRSTRFMYIGNLETYQGIDFMLDAFAMAAGRNPEIYLIIVGGNKKDIESYKKLCEKLGIGGRVNFMGSQPVSMMGELFKSAEVLISPRIKGVNTPMKIYSYLDSGKAVLATDLPTHTQVMNNKVAALVPVNVTKFAEKMLELAKSSSERYKLAKNAKELVKESYSMNVFRHKATNLYERLEKRITKAKNQESLQTQP